MDKIKQKKYMQKNTQSMIKKVGLFLMLGIGILFFGYLFTKHDAFMYQQTIIKVTHVTTQLSTAKRNVQNVNQTTTNQTTTNQTITNKTTTDKATIDPLYWQKIDAVVLNGGYKGKLVTFQNIYTKSGISSERYERNDQIFVKISKNATGTMQVKIIDIKRDMYVFLLVACMVLGLVFLSKKQGILTLVSLIGNVVAFFLCFSFMKKEAFFFSAWIILTVAFCAITLVLTSGIHKKTFGALISSLFSVLIMACLYQVAIYHNQQISYEFMPKMVVTLPLKEIYKTSVIIGLLGAVMDVAITMQATVEGLISMKPDVSFFELISSIQEIGYDIMGTMVNILFFSYMGSSLPLLVIKVYHEYNLSAIFLDTLVFDAGRFLIGAIGLVIAIPISGFFAVLLFYVGRRKTK